MEVDELREKLHEYINEADEQHLTAIYTLVSDNNQTPDIYTEELMNELYQRREDYRNGVTAVHTVEESMNFIRNYKK